MHLNRRHFIHAAAALGFSASRSWAITDISLDDFSIRTVSDGKLVLPMEFLITPDVDRAEIEPILTDAGITGDTVDSPLNVTLVQRGDDLILFDAGSGPDFMPTAGDLPDALDAIGVTPDQITHVVFTHAHPDHIWGVLDDFDEPRFVNARHMIGRIERDFWIDPATMNAVAPSRQSFVAGASRRIETLGDVLEVFEDGDEVVAGVTARLSPGHTPGHMSFDLGGRAFVTGDMVTNAHLGFRRPLVYSGSDQQPEIAAETRLKTLEMLSESELTVIGYHLPDGGIGTVSRDGEGFAFRPA